MGANCQWIHVDVVSEGYWLTECGNTFEFTTGGIEDNGFQFCPYCGNELVEIEKAEDDDE